MADQRPMTQQEWSRHLAELRQRAATPGAALTREEFGELLLTRALDRIDALASDVEHLTRELDDVRRKAR